MSNGQFSEEDKVKRRSDDSPASRPVPKPGPRATPQRQQETHPTSQSDPRPPVNPVTQSPEPYTPQGRSVPVPPEPESPKPRPIPEPSNPPLPTAVPKPGPPVSPPATPISQDRSTEDAAAPKSTPARSAPRIGVTPMAGYPAPDAPAIGNFDPIPKTIAPKHTTFEGFSITHAAVLTGYTPAECADIYGIREGSLEADTDSYDNTGDDAVLSTWNWFNYATVTIQAGYIPFDTISKIYGIPLTSSTTGATYGDGSPIGYYEIGLWTETSLNSPRRPILLRVPSKDANGNVREMDFVLYNCQFEPMSFDGPTYKDGLLLNYSARALMSDNDELGQPLPERAIGRIVNRPPGVAGVTALDLCAPVP